MAKKEKKELLKVEPTKALSTFQEMERRFQEMEKRFEDFFRRPFSLLPSWMPRLRMPEIEEVSPSMDIFPRRSYQMKYHLGYCTKHDKNKSGRRSCQ